MQFLLFGILAFLAFGAFVSLGFYLELKDRRKVKLLMKNIDQKFDKVISQQIDKIIFENNTLDLDIDKISSDTYDIILPQIDGLISQIDAITRKVELGEGYTQYFQNVLGIVSYHLSQEENLDEQERFEIRAAFQTAIVSNLKERILYLKTRT